MNQTVSHLWAALGFGLRSSRWLAGMRGVWIAAVVVVLGFAGSPLRAADAHAGDHGEPFPRTLESYATDGVEQGAGLWDVLKHRVEVEPFNLVATLIFLCAILHTFAAPKILHYSHHLRHEHEEQVKKARQGRELRPGEKAPVSFKAEVMHFFGEVEAVFGIWVIPLLIAITAFESWHTAALYVNTGVNYTEPVFVVVIMAIAGSRPVLRFAEQAMAKIAALGHSTPGAWWLTILTVGPVLGSFITEPAAMTISALLLLQNFYRFNPSDRLRYATLGLLFVNISVGGTLTHFAAPPVLMVAGKWGWGFSHMLLHFGWKAVTGIVIANVLYYFAFRREFASMAPQSGQLPDEAEVEERHSSHARAAIPGWVTAVHLVALGWTVFTAHYTVLFMGGFLVFLAFSQATRHHQDPINLRTPVLVGFFLAGLVIHGTLQQWWIAPVLGSLSELPLMLGAIGLTAFNDNAAITYLASLVPNFSDELKYAVMAGAVAGGGLTVIANAPNPAGQSILSSCFGGGISPLKLLLGALLPTVIMTLCFLLLPSV